LCLQPADHGAEFRKLAKQDLHQRHTDECEAKPDQADVALRQDANFVHYQTKQVISEREHVNDCAH